MMDEIDGDHEGGYQSLLHDYSNFGEFLKRQQKQQEDNKEPSFM